jgi:hypothetical protein
MGLIGTDIAKDFADRIFNIFSTDKRTINLTEYLNYIDVYHHGNDKERCIFTFKVLDRKYIGKVYKQDFSDYINLINSAIKKVHSGAEEDLLTEKEIEMLFNKISNNQPFFNYQQFENIYFNKPNLLSWIDYFKNNEIDILSYLDSNIKTLLIVLERFNVNMSNILENMLKNENDSSNFKFAGDEIKKYCKVIEKKRKEFMETTRTFNLKSVFENLSTPYNVEKTEINSKIINI